MKACGSVLAFLLMLPPAVSAQEHFTEGPLWRIELIRVKPNQMDAYLAGLRESTKPLIVAIPRPPASPCARNRKRGEAR